MRIWGVAILALGLLGFAGCGGADDGGGDELLRYEIEAGEISFELGERQDSAMPIPDALLVVQPDGRATYEFADQPVIEFGLDEAELARLRVDLDAIDFEEADEELSGATEKGAPAFSIAHGGTTVRPGDAFMAINRGEGPAVAERMFDLLDGLDLLIGEAPGVEAATDRWLRAHKLS